MADPVDKCGIRGNQIDQKLLSLTEAQLRGQLVALSGLRLASSEEEKSISACFVWGLGLKETGTANVQNNTVAPTSKESL